MSPAFSETTPPSRLPPNYIDLRTYKDKILSNFYRLPTPLKDNHNIRYPTVEHAYQASKTNNLAHKRTIAESLTTPKQWEGVAAIRAFRSLKAAPDFDFNPKFFDNQLQIMEALLQEKFKIKKFRKELLNTKNIPIIDLSPTGRDTYWGVSPEGYGKNHLGKLMEKIRREIQKNHHNKPPL